MQADQGRYVNDVMHTDVILNCSEPCPKHSRGIRQTPHAPQADKAHRHNKLMQQAQCKLQIVSNKHCLQMTLKREADRHHLFDAVLEKVFRVTDHLGTARSACPHVLASNEDNPLLSVYHFQVHQHLPHRLLYLGWGTYTIHV